MNRDLLLQSYYILGCILYKQGKKVEAAFYFRIAGLEGHDKALLRYAKMLYCGDGIERNRKQAMSYFEELAIRGNSVAAAALAVILCFEGREIARDMEMASRYFNTLNRRYKASVLEALKNANKEEKALELHRNALAELTVINNDRPRVLNQQ